MELLLYFESKTLVSNTIVPLSFYNKASIYPGFFPTIFQINLEKFVVFHAL